MDEPDVRAVIRDLKAAGVEVVVGPGLVNDVAEQAGLRGVFVYSESSVREALGRAIEIARIARVEEARRQRIRRHPPSPRRGGGRGGRRGADREHQPRDGAAARRRRRKGARRAALRIAPGLGLARVLEGGEPELEGIQRLGERTLVTNRIPLVEQGILTGAVLTCQDATAITRVDRSLRSHARPRRFVARHALTDLLGTSASIQRARALAARYAQSDGTVLVTGPTGTGKELVAQGIHSASRRREHPFVAVNCAAFPETLLEAELFGHEEGAFTGTRRGGRAGLFEAAHTGTIFLDEIGEMPLALQTRLLRVLQEREVLRLGSNDPTPIDVRVIAATHRDLRLAVTEGRFREDLFYRLDILHVRLPPLAERAGDVPVLAEHLLRAALRRHGALALLAPALALLLPHLVRHRWPGNVRELENVIERAAILFATAGGEAPTLDDLRAVAPELFDEPGLPASGEPPLRSARDQGERAVIERVLRECAGNQSAAARQLGIGRTTLWRKLRA